METSPPPSASAHLLLFLLSRLPTTSILPALFLLCLLAFISATALWLTPGGPAWGTALRRRPSTVNKPIPGPRGLPILGSLLSLLGHRPHAVLARLSSAHGASLLMAFSIGSTPTVVTSSPSVARELLSSSHFADRPIKQSARLLLFDRAIGFAPYGDYWRKLRRIAATHLFAPRRLAALEPSRQLEAAHLLEAIHRRMLSHGTVQIRPLLQLASINNIMKSVFGRRYDFSGETEHAEAAELRRLTREGFELLGAFNWSDHLPLLRFFDFQGVHGRCQRLVDEVQIFVQRIVDEHRRRRAEGADADADASDFVDVLISLQPQEKLSDTDIIAILWEMIFRGTDTIAILLEWMLAEMVRNPEIQRKAQAEIEATVGRERCVADADIPNLRYVQCIVKETLRMHPPGPLLSWARLATADTEIEGHCVPAGTTAMVNMWAITHDAGIWGATAQEFRPERFMLAEGEDVDVRGGDLRLAPFGAGRRVCPGRAMALATVHLWAARLLHHFRWTAPSPPEMGETLKLSCEMRQPLVAQVDTRLPHLPFF